MTSDSAASPQPIGPTERIDAIDVLRGIALLGVVAMNVVATIAITESEKTIIFGELERDLLKGYQRFRYLATVLVSDSLGPAIDQSRV